MNSQPVPKLNLAPKRRRPFSLWNPLDYLQLLYWVFFFPQALRWYVKNFGEKKKLSDCKTWTEQKEWWSYSRVQRIFWLQGLLSSVLAVSFITVSVSRFGVPVDFAFAGLFTFLGAVFNVVASVAHGVAMGVAAGVSISVGMGVAMSIASATTGIGFFDITYDIADSLAFSLSGGLVIGMVISVMSSAVGEIAFGIPLSRAGLVTLSAAMCVGGSVYGGVVLSTAYHSLSLSTLFGISLCLIGNIAIQRPDVWLHNVLSRRLHKGYPESFSHVTPTPIPGLSKEIAYWLEQDWMQAILNVNELVAYTQQFVPVMNAVNQSLENQPNDEALLLRISQIAENPVDWDILRYISASFSEKAKEQFIHGLIGIPSSYKQRVTVQFDTRLRTNTSVRASAAGFWYLHANKPNSAYRAFFNVLHLPYGAEMQQLSYCLVIALDTEQLNDPSLVAELNIPTSPLLRSDTWSIISNFRSIVDDAQIIYQSYSRSAKSLALNRALGKLTEVLKTIDRVPRAERKLIKEIAKSWKEKLLAIAINVGEVTHTQPVANPYVAGDPVEGTLFVGRGEVIQQLEELWVTSPQLQSVVLYGHRRMGKTSILKNMADYLGNNITVAYVNLLNLGAVSQTQGEGEVLISLSDAISQALSLSPPKDEDLLRLPSATFRRFIQAISQKFQSGQGLIIALDEFEKIEELIKTGALTTDFLGLLRGLLQEYANVAFAFAGLHTIEEMTEDYFNPLFASILPIRIGFLGLGETRQLLANPDEDFTLDFTPDTLNEIYRLSAGQPYLTQLIGFQLVRHCNHQVFEEGRDRSPIFTPEDLNSAIHHSDFFAKGRYYFTGVWNQAAQDEPGQQAILKILAQNADRATSLMPSEIRRKSGLSEEATTQALTTLERHDVVEQEDGKWKIIVPLFRQWVLENQ